MEKYKTELCDAPYPKLLKSLSALTAKPTRNPFINDVNGYMLYRHDEGTFKHCGNLLHPREIKSLPQEHLDDLMNDKYVVMDYFCMLKENNKFYAVGAIILGTTDQKLIENLRTQNLKSRD